MGQFQHNSIGMAGGQTSTHNYKDADNSWVIVDIQVMYFVNWNLEAIKTQPDVPVLHKWV